MISQEFQVKLVKFKGKRELALNLMDRVQELHKGWRKRRSGAAVLFEIAAVTKAMAKCEPLFLDKNAETLDCSKNKTILKYASLENKK